ncbi:hypothetical protein IW261DRAFT_1598210 [Armillaria novae-zelandiae]|uniref:Uncharacterized protein n=1 Tax=Armillaria novae-zelandiae TaxID=153914 RepID=A0AA39U5L7_9AGAR|nr:hypothetical protein IW261DRAFT_1598210 [Armillaria novae-zelandiae]
MSELSGSEIKAIFVALDAQLNVATLTALTHGIHTGVVVVTLWTIASRKKSDGHSRRPQFFCVVIIFLYLLATFNFYCQWAENIAYFGTTGKSFAEVYRSYHISTAIPLAVGIDAILSTVLADVTLIWRCWIVWSRSWIVVVIPIACTLLATASRGIVTFYTVFEPNTSSPQALYLKNAVNWAVLYSSLIMATLLWCTTLIIYRIVRVGGVAGRTRVYQRLIEMLVESALLYSAVIVALLVFEVHNDEVGVCLEVMAIAIRGIAPTILVGRIAAGHARPDDSWSGSSTTSSLRFREHSSSQTRDSEVGAGSEWDRSSRPKPDLEDGLEGSTES